MAHPTTRRAWEAQSLSTTGLLVARSALAREESRGAHYRTDFPAHNDAKFLEAFSWQEAVQFGSCKRTLSPAGSGNRWPSVVRVGDAKPRPRYMSRLFLLWKQLRRQHRHDQNSRHNAQRNLSRNFVVM